LAEGAATFKNEIHVMKHIFFILTILLFVACDKGGKISPNQDISVKSNKEVSFKFDSKQVSIKVNNVDDSRCPESAQCIRAGEAIVTFDIVIDGKEYPNEKLCIICEPPMFFPKEKQYGDYTLLLSEVSPYPSRKNKITENTVVFQMR
jgi:hypothetical protein